VFGEYFLLSGGWFGGHYIVNHWEFKDVS
jgi:hypothetical protein